MTEIKAAQAEVQEVSADDAAPVVIELMRAGIVFVDEYADKQIDALPDACRTFKEIPEFEKLGIALAKAILFFQEE